MSDTSQDLNASVTYTEDLTNRLAKAYPGETVTITTATVTASAGTVSGVTHTSTGVSWKLATSTVTVVPSDVVVLITPTYSNGDVDPFRVYITVTDS